MKSFSLAQSGFWRKDPFFIGLALTVFFSVISLCFGAPSRSYHNGMIVTTQPHFLIAYLFFFTSSRMKRKGSWKIISLLLGLALALSLLYLWGQRIEAWLQLVYMYFIWHMLRDEVFIRLPLTAPQSDKRILFVLSLGLWVFLYVLLVGANVLYLIQNWPMNTFKAVGLYKADYRMPLFLAAAGVLGGWTILMSRVFLYYQRSLSDFCREYRNLLLVMAGLCLFGIIVCFLQLRTWFTLNALIFFHVCSWYGYSLQRIRCQPLKAPENWKQWPRSSVFRFNVFYIGAQILVLAGFIYYQFYAHDPSWMKYYYGREYFPIWTLFHITLSYFPR